VEVREPEEATMAFATITQGPVGTLAGYREITAAVGTDRPDGLLLQVAGECEEGLQIVSVRESGVHHDRFVAERLHPAIRRAGLRPDPGMRHMKFEVGDLGVAAALAPSGS
jgi:hypothetical protein